MKLPDLDEFFDGDLYLPWAGQKWRIAEPTAVEAERLRIEIFAHSLEGDREIHEIRKLLGQTWNDLLDAGIGWSHLLHIGRTALIHFTTTPELAEQHWKLAQLSTLLDLDAVMTLAKG